MLASCDYNKDVDADLIEGNSFYCKNPAIVGYNKIVISVFSMEYPYRFLKINHILFGFRKVFTQDEIMTANTLQEIDILSSKLAINTLDFTISDNDRRFNCINPLGVYEALQEKQEMIVYEYFDDVKMLIGKFYLESWSSPGEARSKFKAEDAIGLLNKLEFKGGVYSNVLVSDLVEKIFEDTEIDYELQEDLADICISGYIPKCKRREALQQVLFVIGAVADTSQSDKLKIYTINQNNKKTSMTKDRKWNGASNYEPTDIVTGIDITCYSFSPEIEEKELFKQILSVGNHVIEFSNPVVISSIKITGATITLSSENFINISVSKSQEVIIRGKKYIENKSIKQYRQKLKFSKVENVLTVQNAKLVNNSNVDSIANRIFNYYKKQYKTKAKFKMLNEKVGDCISVDTLYDNFITGNITSMNIDLTGGALATTTVVGKLLDTDERKETL